MTLTEALGGNQGLARVNRIEVLRPHASDRMAQRRVGIRDVQHALVTASSCVDEAGKGRWKVPSADLDGDELTVVVEIEDGLLVVTVF